MGSQKRPSAERVEVAAFETLDPGQNGELVQMNVISPSTLEKLQQESAATGQAPN